VRQAQAVGHGPVKQMQIGAADSAIFDADLHLARGRFHRDAGADLKLLISFEKGRSHKFFGVPQVEIRV
jgi:hypothetical protein